MIASRLPASRWPVALAGLILLAMLMACQPDALEPPRVATLTAQASLSPTPTLTPVISAAPTATPGGAPSQAAAGQPAGDVASSELIIWLDDPSDAGAEALAGGIADFTAETGIHVELVHVADRLLPDLMASAVVSDTLPDLILHPLEYSQGWAERGILDPAAATAVLDALGRDTFAPGALDQLTIDEATGAIAALPSDGWQQLLLYRTDWFAERELAPPETYANLSAAAEAIFEEESPVSGLIVPTDSSLVSTQYVFEHLAIANGCRLADRQGEVTLLSPACLEALEYYRALINAYSPIGLQTDISALNGYLAGRTGIIIASPAALPAIAGLSDDARPSCPQCAAAGYLAENTGLLTRLRGDAPGAPSANFSTIHALGITSAADNEAATTFAQYWFETLYPAWLAVDPELKVPMRRGTGPDDDRFLALWAEAPLAPGGPTLADIYGAETVALLSEDLAQAERWGLAHGQGPLVTTIYEELLLAPLLQDMLSGYFTSSQTIVEMYLAVVDAIPGYPFPIQVAPTPTP